MILWLRVVAAFVAGPSIAITVAFDWLINRSTWPAYVASVTHTTCHFNEQSFAIAKV